MLRDISDMILSPCLTSKKTSKMRTTKAIQQRISGNNNETHLTKLSTFTISRSSNSSKMLKKLIILEKSSVRVPLEMSGYAPILRLKKILQLKSCRKSRLRSRKYTSSCCKMSSVFSEKNHIPTLSESLI